MLTKKNNSFLKYKTFGFLKVLSISIVLVTLFTRCYVPSEYLESDLIPESERLGVKTDTTFILSAHTVSYNDTINTNAFDVIVLGAINNNVFGRVKSSFLSQIRLSSTGRSFGLEPSVDSAFFILNLSEHYGDKSIPLNVSIYELSDSIKSDSTYNSLLPIGNMIDNTPIGTITYQGESQLKIPLDNEWATKLIVANTETMASQEGFTKYIKGFYFTVDHLNTMGKAMYYFNYSDSKNKLVLYYTATYSNKIVDTTFNYLFSSGALRNLRFEHDHSTAVPTNAILNLNDTITQDSVFYLQGLGGTKGLIKLEGLTEWVSKMPVLINRAELRIEPEQVPFFESDSIMTSIDIYKKSSNEYSKIYDTFLPTFGGDFIKYKGYYSFNITNHIQEQLQSSTPDFDIYLEPRTRFSRASQTILKTANNSQKIKLIITYTKL